MSDTPYLQGQTGVLGSLLCDGAAVSGTVMHRLREEDFSGPYRTIFRACQALFKANKPIDSISVSGIIGPSYDSLLVQIMDLTPTSANCDIYIDLTIDQAKVIQLRQLGTQLASAASLEDAQQLLAQANRVQGGRPSVQVVSMEQGFLDFYDRMQTKAQLLTWGLDKLDGALRAEPGDFVVLGGYPSAGKTALSLQLAWHQAKDKRVGYFSLETKPEKLIDRTVAAVCGVDFGRVKNHSLTQEDWASCSLKSDTVTGRKLEIIQAGGLSVVDIQALALAGQYAIIYVDYLQLIVPEDRRRSDVEQVTQISKDLHTLAQTTGITVCALSQLSRPPKSGEQERAPGLHSLRQSGQIEQDADGVLLLYKEEPKNPRSLRCLKIAKNKEGEAGGIVCLTFDGARQRFQESLFGPYTPKRQELEYKKQALYSLPGSEPSPWSD